ncbi:hypothetical protein [Mucilaginibacter flavus]|uniref:hypothetical protein n=1 Tax=Mucilaginibacter flavus TaxID=931504 RepID=UPI0025B4E993|nr:hypothetical protein [Mucilaginibacter flavus]MDN3581126.1 hypothetical protein [Mucilaginibacter flavus]
MRKSRKYDFAQPLLPDNSSENDFWTDVPEEIKRAIQEAKDQLNSGEGIEHSQIMAKMRARFLSR